MTKTTERRIYVACLAAYNAGTLHGKWIDVDGLDAAEIMEEVNAMLAESPEPNVRRVDCSCEECGHEWRHTLSPFNSGPECPECGETEKIEKDDEYPSAEEWAIHDHEGFYGLIGEYTSFERIAELAELLDEHGEAYAVYVNHHGEQYATPEGFQDEYCGEWDSEEAFAENLADDLGYMDQEHPLLMYVDFERFARDLFIGDYFSDRGEDGTLYVFRRC